MRAEEREALAMGGTGDNTFHHPEERLIDKAGQRHFGEACRAMRRAHPHEPDGRNEL
jgi:hypothetical protein